MAAIQESNRDVVRSSALCCEVLLLSAVLAADALADWMQDGNTESTVLTMQLCMI
jgi:hypothetical protein